MPDPIPPEIHFKVAETLHYGGETTLGAGVLSAEMQGFKDRAAKLREERARNPNDGKSFLDSLRNKPSERNLTVQNRADLDLQFGAGETKRDSSGTIEAPKTPEAKALYDEAQAEIKNITSFIQYSEIIAEAKKTGKTIAAILNERRVNRIEGPTDQTGFDTQKEQVLDYLINTEVIQKGFPELASITNPADRRKLMEETLAADSALRAKILEKMVGIAERAKNLPEPPVSKEVKDAEDNKKEAETIITENLEMVRDRLKELGIDDTKAEALKKEVGTYLKEGKSLDQVLGYLRSELMGQLRNVPAIEGYLKAYNLAENLQKKIDQYILAKVDSKQIVALQAELTKQEAAINLFDADTALVAEFGNYQNIVRVFTSQKDNSSSTTEGGIFLSPVANGLDQIIKAQKTMLTADKVIKEKGEQSKKDQEAWKANRLVQESNLISEMKNVIQSSVAEVLSARYDEMVDLEKQRMAKIAENEAKKGNETVASGIKKVEEAKAKNWIEYDQGTRRKEVHDYKLGSDIKYVAYAGEDGIKRLILRDSGLQPKDAAGNPVAIDWKTADLSILPEEVRKTLEEIYSAQKDSYKQKLFGDFFLGKNFMDRIIFGKPFGELALKKHEYELLERNFTEAFSGRINSKAEAKAAVEKLKASGIKMNGGLLAILGLLLATPFLGAKKLLTGEE